MATVESWDRWVEARYRETEEQATDDWQRVAQERAMRPRREWKRLAVRLRGQCAVRANRSGQRALSQCLRRRSRERYTGSTLVAAAEPWELELAEALEERFVTIRRVARNFSRFRVAVRQHAKLVRQITEQAVRKTLRNFHSKQNATLLVKAYMTCISSSPQQPEERRLNEGGHRLPLRRVFVHPRQ